MNESKLLLTVILTKNYFYSVICIDLSLFFCIYKKIFAKIWILFFNRVRVFQSLDSMFNQKKKFYLKKGKNLHITWALTFYIYHQQICKKSPHVFVLPSFANVLTQLVQNFCIAGESCYLRANPCKNSCSLCRKTHIRTCRIRQAILLQSCITLPKKKYHRWALDWNKSFSFSLWISKVGTISITALDRTRILLIKFEIIRGGHDNHCSIGWNQILLI